MDHIGRNRTMTTWITQSSLSAIVLCIFLSCWRLGHHFPTTQCVTSCKWLHTCVAHVPRGHAAGTLYHLSAAEQQKGQLIQPSKQQVTRRVKNGGWVIFETKLAALIIQWRVKAPGEEPTDVRSTSCLMSSLLFDKRIKETMFRMGQWKHTVTLLRSKILVFVLSGKSKRKLMVMRYFARSASWGVSVWTAEGQSVFRFFRCLSPQWGKSAVY